MKPILIVIALMTALSTAEAEMTCSLLRDGHVTTYKFSGDPLSVLGGKGQVKIDQFAGVHEHLSAEYTKTGWDCSVANFVRSDGTLEAAKYCVADYSTRSLEAFLLVGGSKLKMDCRVQKSGIQLPIQFESGNIDEDPQHDSCYEDCGRPCLEPPVFCGQW